jgi:hypothetical protein
MADLRGGPPTRGDGPNGRGPLWHFEQALAESADAAASNVPEPPRRGVGTALRSLTGVDEGLLARAAPERPKYTKLGVVILGIAAVATFSMWLALGEVFDEVTLIALVPAIGWGILIATFDSWLVSSMHGLRWRNRIWMVLPRLALSVLFGIVIAEPMVLRLFESAIEQHIEDARDDAIGAYETKLQRCNPNTGEALSLRASRSCGDARLTITVATPDALKDQLRDARQRKTTLAGDVRRIEAQQRHQEYIARKECNGGDGPGFSGQVGVGPNCVRDRTKADEYARTSGLEAKQQALDALNRRIGTLETQVKTQTETYETAVETAIAEKVADRESHQGSIGLLERLDAIGQLAGQHWHIAVATWLLRLLFIVIDCLPMLVKIMGGTTSYDVILDERLGAIERIHHQEERTEELRRTGRLRLVQYRLEREGQSAREGLDRELRVRHAEEDVALDAHIDRLTAKLLGENLPGSPPTPDPA